MILQSFLIETSQVFPPPSTLTSFTRHPTNDTIHPDPKVASGGRGGVRRASSYGGCVSWLSPTGPEGMDPCTVWQDAHGQQNTASQSRSHMLYSGFHCLVLGTIPRGGDSLFIGVVRPGGCVLQETQGRQATFITYPLSVNEGLADKLMAGQLRIRIAMPCALNPVSLSDVHWMVAPEGLGSGSGVFL